jgi:hypothetical protein
MRSKVVVVAASVAASVAVAVAVAVAGALASAGCSGPSCKPGTLLLHVALLDDAPLADHIVVSGDDPGAAVSQSFPHTPDPDAAALQIQHVAVTVTWPGSYPAHAKVNLVVRAFAGATVLGTNGTTINLLPGCTESSVLVSNRLGVDPDGGEQ